MGALAGYGIAVPVGAIAVLIVQTGMRCGVRCAAAAGAGTDTPGAYVATYARFLGLTIVNPMTVVYFAARCPTAPTRSPREPGTS